MLTNDLQLRTVSQLLGESFFIPAYQRGYRWTVRQVTELLQDVFAFMKEQRRAKGEFYCLQPVVVARRGAEKRWELIDGQQRLTTIYLVLSYLNNRFTAEFRKQLFALEYETRETSADYLRSLDEDRHQSNIDFYFMWQAYQAICGWFKDKASLINDIESAFLNDVKVIWYEVHAGVKSIEVFTRLNIGKIPLTNAELVKALFLRGSNFEGEGEHARHLQQTKIAQEWDEIERRLQDDVFWCFLTNERKEANRIDFVLSLRAGEVGNDPALHGDPGYLFLVFNEHLTKNQGTIAEEWDSVKRVFLYIDEWFRDRYLYHVIGFLLTLSVDVSRVRKFVREAQSKTAFRDALKSHILIVLFEHTEVSRNHTEVHQLIADRLENLDYGSGADRKVIRDVLLLFNIVSLLESGDAGTRFPFDRFKKERWDLEHIRSVKSSRPERKDDQKSWLDNVLEYLSEPEASDVSGGANVPDATLTERLRILRDTEPFQSNEFAAVFDAVIERYDPGSDAEADNGIGNLTLLDAATNRGYGNAIFPYKRRKVIALDKAGKFVPLCTKNAFLKYYSPKINEMLIWTRKDSANHQEAIVDSITRFFITGGAQP